MPDFSTNPAEALGEFSEVVKGQLSAADESITALSARVEAVETRAAHMSTEEAAALDTRFSKLATSDQIEEAADRLKRLETKIERAGQFGGAAPKPTNAWQEHFESPEFAKYIEDECKSQDKSFRTKVPIMLGRGRGGQFAVTVDADLVGDLDVPHTRPGVIELLRDPIGLVDVVNVVPPIGSETYEYFKETEQSELAALGTTLAAAIDGDPTAKTTATVTNSQGFVPGANVLFYTSGGIETLPLVSKVDSTGVLTFAADAITFDAAAGSLVTTQEILATQEAALKPAGFVAGAKSILSLQTIAVWLETTRQRLMYTNVIDLASWINRKLPQRHRETLEWHLLYGAGEDDELHGFLNTSTPVLPTGNVDVWSTAMETGDGRADLVLYSANQIPGAGPTVCVMHKNDWYRLRTAKASDGHYLQSSGEGPRIINTPGLKAIDDVQVVLTRKIVETTALVFNPPAASEVVPAGDAELWTGFTGDQRLYNKQTHLYEQSLGNAILDTRAFRKVSFDSAPA